MLLDEDGVLCHAQALIAAFWAPWSTSGFVCERDGLKHVVCEWVKQSAHNQEQIVVMVRVCHNWGNLTAGGLLAFGELVLWCWFEEFIYCNLCEIVEGGNGKGMCFSTSSMTEEGAGCILR